MLSKKQRVPKDLFNLFLGAKRGDSKHFSLKFVESDKEKRVAVSVSKKVSKSAVLRNRTRRRAYSSVSKIFPSISNGLYLISAKADSENIKGEELDQELAVLLQRS